MYDAAADLLTFPYHVDEYDNDFPSKRPGKGLTEYVLRTGEPLLVTPEVQAELERRGQVELIGAPSIDWVGVPLKIGDRPIGVLVAQTYAPGVRYGETERHILQFVSTQVAMAIERKRTEERLHESERKYRLLFETNPEPMFVYDFDTLRIMAANEAAIARYGYSESEFLALTIRDIRSVEEQGRLDQELARRPDEGAVRTGVRHRAKDGRLFEVDLVARPLEFAGRRARLVLARDVTAQRHLEDQLRQSQKMEAVGQLAGGIAHDFNNLLTAILGSTQLLLQATPPGDVRREDVEEIRNAGLRAAELTRQLLAFSRRQVLAPKVLELNAVVANMDKMLRRLIGDDVELAHALHDGAGRGTTVKVYLPRVPGAAEPPLPEPEPPALRGGHETVLLVEDAAPVRTLARRSLEACGYQVIDAADGPKALELSARHSGEIAVLVTDVVMPGMSGRELAERLAPTRPAMKVLYTSGYTDDAMVRQGVLNAGVAFLQKPFVPDSLAA